MSGPRTRSAGLSARTRSDELLDSHVSENNFVTKPQIFFAVRHENLAAETW
jgi:hypothetical protein